MGKMKVPEMWSMPKHLQKSLAIKKYMTHDDTRYLMATYDKLRVAWGFSYPCEKGLI